MTSTFRFEAPTARSGLRGPGVSLISPLSDSSLRRPRIRAMSRNVSHCFTLSQLGQARLALFGAPATACSKDGDVAEIASVPAECSSPECYWSVCNGKRQQNCLQVTLLNVVILQCRSAMKAYITPGFDVHVNWGRHIQRVSFHRELFTA